MSSLTPCGPGIENNDCSLDLISFINVSLFMYLFIYLSIYFLHFLTALFNLFHSEMQNEKKKIIKKNEFLNFSVLVLKVFNVIWLTLLVL